MKKVLMVLLLSSIFLNCSGIYYVSVKFTVVDLETKEPISEVSFRSINHDILSNDSKVEGFTGESGESHFGYSGETLGLSNSIERKEIELEFSKEGYKNTTQVFNTSDVYTIYMSKESN